MGRTGATVRQLLVVVLVLVLCDAKKRAASGGKVLACEDAKSAKDLVKKARKLTSGGDPGTALRCLEVGTRRFEQSGEVWEELGALSDDMGMKHEALEMLERAIALKPTLGLAALRLGNIYSTLNDDDRAITFFKKASKARPDSPVPYNNIGLAHMRKGRTQEALETFKRGMDDTPEGAFGRAMILNNLGLLLKQMGSLEEAVQSFQQVRSLHALLVHTSTNTDAAAAGISHRAVGRGIEQPCLYSHRSLRLRAGMGHLRESAGARHARKAGARARRRCASTPRSHSRRSSAPAASGGGGPRRSTRPRCTPACSAATATPRPLRDPPRRHQPPVGCRYLKRLLLMP